MTRPAGRPEASGRVVSGKMLQSRYRLDEVIDGGATATVWRAYDTQLDRAVAIKILDRRRPGPLSDDNEDDQRRFRDEARALARLSHPHIVTVFDSGTTESGAGFLVMELVEGRSVSSRLADGVLPFVETAAIMVQVCDGLAAAHAAGIVHRDIKPANIVVTSGGTAKVCDFGIARLHGTPSLTSPDIAVGTSSYMAPEQVSSQQVDGRADLYAVGCVLFEMLTGEPPFVGETALGIAYQHVHAQAPSLRSRRPDTPRELEALTAHLLAKDPGKRPADAAQVRAELAAFVAARDTVAIARRAASRLGRLSNPRVRVAVVAAVVVALPAIAFASWPGWRTEPSPASDPGAMKTTPSTTIGSSVPSPGASPDPALSAGAAPGPLPGPGEPGGPGTVPTGPAGPTAQATAPTSPGVSPATAPTPLQQVANLRSLVRRLESDGQLATEDANDLIRVLNSVANSISQGMTAEAQDKIARMRVRNDELLRDNKISASGHDRLDAGLVRLSASL